MPSPNNKPTIENPVAEPTAGESAAVPAAPADKANPAAQSEAQIPGIPTASAQKKPSTSTLKAAVILRSYVVPLLVLSIFGAMLIFLILPKISEILGKLEQTNSLYDQTRIMDAEIQTIFALNQDQAQFGTDLLLINQIAPSGATEVVNFHQKVLGLIQANGLTVQQSSLEESVKQAEDQASSSSLGIIEIPSTFTLNGPFSGLKRFVEQIRSLSDFVIIGEMALRANIDPNAAVGLVGGGQDNWTLIITLIKYQFQEPNEQNKLQQIFQKIPPNLKPDQTVIDFAREKFATETPGN